MKKLFDYLPIPRSQKRLLLAAILSASQLAAASYESGCTLDRSGTGRAIADAGSDGDSIPDSEIAADTGTISEDDSGTLEEDSGPPPPTVHCGRGLIPGFPLTAGIPEGTAMPVEIAVGRPGPTDTAEADFGDATVEAAPVIAGDFAPTTHTYTGTEARTLIWRLNGAECGRQTFDVIRNTCTGSSVSSSEIRVGEAVTLRLFNSSTSPDDTYVWNNLPTDPNTVSQVGISTITITSEDPPGSGAYPLDGRIIKSSGQYFQCPPTTLTVL